MTNRFEQPQAAEENESPIDTETSSHLEEKFSQPFEDLKPGEYFDEAFRLLQQAHSGENEEDWLALWWFFRRTEDVLHHELPGQEEELLSAYQHIKNVAIRNDIENGYKRRPKPGKLPWGEIDWKLIA